MTFIRKGLKSSFIVEAIVCGCWAISWFSDRGYFKVNMVENRKIAPH